MLTVVFLVWVYYSSLIFLFGAQLTQVSTPGGRYPARRLRGRGATAMMSTGSPKLMRGVAGRPPAGPLPSPLPDTAER